MVSDSESNAVEKPQSKEGKPSKIARMEKIHEKRRSSRSRSGTPEKDSQRKRRHKRRYSDDRNSDQYWNKYPKRDENVVGQRYYEELAHSDPEENRDNRRSSHRDRERERDKTVIKPRERKTVDLLTSKTGGAYIPPAKLRMMQAEITDKSSMAFQRIAWEALKKSIHGYINKVNTSNIGIIARELLHENIVRGRGLLCKSIIQAQAASPTFTNVYAALVAVINSKFPNIGELLLKRLVLQFRRGFKQNNKSICISASTFVAHLVNQCVVHEILALEILTLLIESPTDSSIEVAIAFLKECGQKLSEVSRKGKLENITKSP